MDVLRRPEELTADWLERALACGPVSAFSSEAIGTGQMSESRRVHVAYSDGARPGPATVVLKTASADEGSRSTGVNLGVYEREVRFYRELAPRIGGPLARCYAAEIDPAEGWFTLLLEDVAPAAQGDQIAGTDLEHARVAVAELARIHAPLFGDPQLAATPWLNQPSPLGQAVMTQLLEAFVERYRERLDPAHEEVCRRFVSCLDGWSASRRPPLGLVHGDYRLDNLLFGSGEGSRPLVAVDWQTVSWGPVMSDLSYFLGGSLPTAQRREHERGLVSEYLEALHAHGVRGFGWEECWEGYRRQSFLGLVMTVAPALLVERTERGDDMFLTTLARYAEQILDLDCLALLPPPGSGRPAPLRPEPADERRHDPGPEQLWNESWYFDAISDDERLGVYTRIGLYPNLGVCWFTAFICRAGGDSVAIVDYGAPLPRGDELSIDLPGLRADHRCVSALERFHVRVSGRGEAHADAAAFLRGEPGEPVAAALDLEWTTQGDPYAYRAATRYEIPCSVRGSVSVGGEETELSGGGQRDHSWGTRDWWAADWMWSAGGLEDGTRFHAVEFRIPGAPPVGVGYLQPPAGGVEEPDRVSASEEVAADGLITSAEIELGALALSVEPLAFGPLLLNAPDGRTSQFPRAMCRVTAGDGRRGRAWVEWNRNMRP